MTKDDKDKIIKLLQLTTSSNDHEALLAMRVANKILKKTETTWDKFLDNPPAASTRPNPTASTYRHYDYGPSITEMLHTCLEQVKTDSGYDFINSLYQQYRYSHRLSPKQTAALKKFYRNCMR
jgi:Protein of unknown function (DUF2786)